MKSEGLDAAVQEVLSLQSSQAAKRRLFPRAMLAGVGAGLVGAAFHRTLDVAEHLRSLLADRLGQWPGLAAATIGVLAFLATMLSLWISSADRKSSGSGIPHVKAVLEGHGTLKWWPLVPAKFLGAAIAIGAGLGLGREGPTVQMAAATGSATGDLTHATGDERRSLVAAGAGAGLAAAFNAPIAGVTFVLEELQRDFHPEVFAAALLCAGIATVIARFLGGQRSVFAVPTVEEQRLVIVPLFALVGLIGGLVGVLFNKTLMSATAAAKTLGKKRILVASLMAGVATAAAFALSPLLLGGGHLLSEAALKGGLTLGSAILFLLVRFLFIQASYATGVPGGIFAPLLSLGALLGVAVAAALQAMHVPGLSTTAFAVSGMCAMFCGVVRAPLTGVILIAEMTGSYDLLLPLLVASFTSYAVADLCGDVPIYDALLIRDAKEEGFESVEGGLVVAEFTIQANSSFQDKEVRELGLPRGVLLTAIRHQSKSFVPKPTTVLRAHQRLEVRVERAADLEIIVEGVRSRNER